MSIALSIGNNLTTNGVFTADAVNNTSVTNVTDFASVPGGGALKLLSTQTASASATIDFTSGIDSTYDSYVFKFINIHPATDDVNFEFQASTNNGSSYGVTATTTVFRAGHAENDTTPTFGYFTNDDLAQSTSYQRLDAGRTGNGNDEHYSGTLQIFNPSSTTFVKHFIATGEAYKSNDQPMNSFIAGYFNTTSAVDAVQFKFDSGNIDDGIIKMYGVV